MSSNSPIENPHSDTESPKSFVPAEVEPDVQTAKPLLKKMPSWRFWVPLVFQSALIVVIPAQDAYTSITGRPVTLQTAPIDPYDLLRGYSQTLSYTISRPSDLEELPGGKEFFNTHRANEQFSFYVVLEAPKSTNTNPPTPWKPVRVSATHPTNLAANQVALRGEYAYGQVLYGLETYYMPEDQRNQLNAEIGQVQRQQSQAFVVDIKVDAQGNSVPVSLWVGDRNYRF
ncbi:GDYXXLXY domain-containing protein [Leptothermofonsia sp. ETS-13]|uniref:GDYXXLXY domain-containing protein n=1 Tax=Leptothermofonsia sp. ETS-13 TaxID=3035696 RepID=UPI003BA3DE6E